MDSDSNRRLENDKKKKKEKNEEVRIRQKLKDLFVSSPPLEDRVPDKRVEEQEETEQLVVLLPATASVGGSGAVPRRGGAGRGNSFRPITATFRYRLLRRAWRPVLVTIPE